jgi:P27 family predicted phage terminase small subunit
MRRTQKVTRRPAAPEHLDSGARDEWDRLARQLAKRGPVEPADLAILEAAAKAIARGKKADAELGKSGEVVRSAQGGAIQSPWLSVSRAAWRDARQALAELRLTPASRKKQPDEAVDDNALSVLDVG